MQTVRAMRIEGRRREDAKKNNSERAAYAVHAPDIERVVPFERFFSATAK